MSTLSRIFGALVKLICGSAEPSQEQQHHQEEQTHQKPHKQERPPHATSPPVHHKFEDDNQKNQQNEYYRGLRAQANAEGDSMARCFQESRQVYSQGNGGRAKELSNQGKAHQQKMEELNKKASDWIYVENNRDSQPGEIDLHGLYVKEAIFHTDMAIEEAKRRGDSEVRLIVGKGLHSSGGAAKVRPAIEELMEKHSLVANMDPQNAGVLVVEINTRRDRGFRPDEISRRLDRDDEGCVVM